MRGLAVGGRCFDRAVKSQHAGQAAIRKQASDHSNSLRSYKIHSAVGFIIRIKEKMLELRSRNSNLASPRSV